MNFLCLLIEDRAFTCGISMPSIFKKNIIIQTVHFRLKRYPLLMPFPLLSSSKLLNDYLLRKIYENCSFPRVAWRHFKTECISWSMQLTMTIVKELWKWVLLVIFIVWLKETLQYFENKLRCLLNFFCIHGDDE